MQQTPEHPSDVVAARLASFTDRLVEITRQRALLDAAETRLLAEAAAYSDATVGVAVASTTTTSPSERRALARRSLGACLAMATHTAEQTMQRRINDAEVLVQTAPDALEALARGSVSLQHCRIITDQLSDVPIASRAAFVARILPIAERTTPSRAKQRARVLRERLHPESITARAVRSEADRRVEFEPAADGMAWLHLLTTASIAQGVVERLDALADEQSATGDDRTRAQLRADALGTLAVSGVTPLDIAEVPGSLIRRPVVVEARIRATVQVTVPVLTLLDQDDEPGMLDGYGPIPADTAARLAVTAPSMTRVLVHPETGAVLSVGRAQYRVPADLQRAVRLRDVTCRAPGCNRRARACDLDHSTSWQDGGGTAVDNLAAICRHHHRLKHLPGWSLDHTVGAVLDWTTPDGRHHVTAPESQFELARAG